MMEFAVSVEGLVSATPGKWVLAVDPVGERFLIAHDDNTLHWHPMADCTLFRAANPDQPRPVVPIQPKQSSGIEVPRVILGGNGQPQ